ncbi:unnamed protein product, partial [marine sediment metagenome]
IGISDRILVLCRGKIEKCFSYEEVTEEKLLMSASGVDNNKKL